MTNKDLSYEITDFFSEHNMMGGATYNEMFSATLNALNDNDIKIIIDYFDDLILINDKAKRIYEELDNRRR